MPHGTAPLDSVLLAPRVWVLTGNKAGDNSQVLALAEALGWPFEIKRFVHTRFEIVPNMLLRTTVAGIDREQSSPLEAPWPDLVISAGRRNEPIARWIKKQAPEHVRLVHVGRPWSRLHHFDLIVTTPQYRLPVRPNVLHNQTPLHRVTKERLAREAARWRDRLADLPQPHIAVVVGGSSGPYSFCTRAAERLARQASDFAKQIGGSLLITTSARTPAAAIDVMEQTIDVPAHFFRWEPNARDNPYFAFLGLAEQIIVTGDSMSMLAEACATRKPVHIFDLGEGEGAMRPATVEAAKTLRQEHEGKRPLEGTHIRAFLYRQLMRFGPERLGRDIRIIHTYLVDSGRAVWLGDAFAADRPLPAMDCLGRAVGRVRALIEDRTGIVSIHPRSFSEPANTASPLRRSA
ncbi:MAG: mitochondrial fission ELM1 family protein [Rhodospirillales bacterium]|nr:mitochondrial fission ELM1 family protein [Rhodospirillales bacterium]